MNKDISVLLPVYNVEKYIEKTLLSLFNNTIIDKTEIIILNDCSQDNSMEIIYKLCNKYPSINVQIYNNKSNKGISYTRQVLLNHARGKYLIFVDSDDIVEKNYLELMYNEAEKTQADIVGCKLIIESNNGSKTEIPVQEYGKNGHEWILLWETEKLSNWLHTRLIRRDTITKNNITFIDNINWGEDTIFLTQLYTKNITVSHIDDVLYHYIRHNDSLSMQLTNEIKADHLIKTQNHFEIILNESYEQNDEVFTYLNSVKSRKKKAIIFNGTWKAQKKYISLWPEIDSTIMNSDFRILDKIILTSKLKTLSLVFLFCRSIVKIILRKEFTLKNYLS